MDTKGQLPPQRFQFYRVGPTKGRLPPQRFLILPSRTDQETSRHALSLHIPPLRPPNSTCWWSPAAAANCSRDIPPTPRMSQQFMQDWAGPDVFRPNLLQAICSMFYRLDMSHNAFRPGWFWWSEDGCGGVWLNAVELGWVRWSLAGCGGAWRGAVEPGWLWWSLAGNACSMFLIR
eukprot:351211-Chlamydomonas_euryale.AAC.1